MKKIDSSGFILILANLVPLIGVLFFKWDHFSLLMGYWVETGVICIFTIAKLVYIYKVTFKPVILIVGISVLSTSAGFMFAHFIGIMSLFSTIPGGDGFTGLNLFKDSSTQLLTMFITLCISHGYSFIYNFFGRDEKKSIISLVNQTGANSSRVGNVITGDFMTRVGFTQFIIIVGVFITGITRTTLYISVIFIVLKILVDLTLHNRKHKQARLMGA